MNIVFVLRGALPNEKRQRAVAFLSRSRGVDRFCHVDLCVVSAGEAAEAPPAVFSAYMGEPLLRVPADECGFSNKTDTALALSVSAEEGCAASEYLEGLVRRGVLYNYADLPLCLLPRAMHSTVQDVQPDAVERVFCSQLVVLTLRKALAPCTAVAPDIVSRCTSPNALYTLLGASCRRVRAEALATGRVVPVA